MEDRTQLIRDEGLIRQTHGTNGAKAARWAATPPMVWALVGSNFLLLGLVVWMAFGSNHADTPTPSPLVHDEPRELLLPLQPQIRRELFDVNLFDEPDDPYARYPVLSKLVKTTCVIDVVQAATYLGKAAVNIYRAEICPDGEPLGCTAPVAHAITSFIWVTAFLTSAASNCAKTVRQGASCAAAIMRDLATAGSTIYGFDEDCYLTNPRDTSWRVFQRWYEHLKPDESDRRLSEFLGVHNVSSVSGEAVSTYRAKSQEFQARLRNLTDQQGRARLPNVLFDAESKGLPRDLLSKLQKVKAIDGHNSYKRERNFALANCVFDSVAATTWIMRALLSIEEAARNCPDPRDCTVDILYVIGSFSYAAQTLSLAFVDCPKRGKREALCGADIADVVGSMAIFVASTLQAAEYCDATFRRPGFSGILSRPVGSAPRPAR